MWNVHRHLYALLFALMPFVRVRVRVRVRVCMCVCVGRCCEFLEDVSEDVCACPLCVCRFPGTFRVECASSFVRVAARGRCCEFLEDVSEDVVNSWKMYRKTYTLFGKTWQTLKLVKRFN